MTDEEYRQEVNPCWGCSYWDPDLGCGMPAVERAYACSLEAEGCVEDGD